MGFYHNQIVPILTDLAMRQRNLAAYRSRVVPAADGRVLEIGVKKNEIEWNSEEKNWFSQLPFCP
jgi:hypothetical protein